MSKIDHALFNAKKHALEKEYEVCPDCGSELVIKNSKKGPFIGCASYPTCEYISLWRIMIAMLLKYLKV